MKPPLSYIPLFPLLVAMVAGIVFERLGQFWWCGVVILVISAFLPLIRQRYFSIIAITGLLGWITGFIHEPRTFEELPQKHQTFEGTVEKIKEYDGGRTLTVNTGDFKARVTVPSLFPLLDVGDIISFSGNYSPVKLNTDLPLEYDGVNDSYNKYITLRCFSPPDSIKPLGKSNSIFYRMQRLRDKAIDRIYEANIEGPTASFLAAIVLGDDSEIDADTRESFNNAGVSHLLALSGMHVSIIAFIVVVAFFPLVLSGWRRTRWVLSIIVLWFYAVLTGLSPSVVRSVLMTTIVLMSFLMDKPRSSLNALCFAAIVILIFDPRALYGIGFQLSFIATLFIILFSNRLNPFGIIHKRLSSLISPLTVTLAATFGTAGLVAYYFHKLPLYSVFTNIPIVLFAPLMISGGLLIIFLGALSVSTPLWICQFLDFLYNILLRFVEFSGALPRGRIEDVYFSPWLLIPYYGSLALLFCFIVLRKKLYGLMSAILFIFTIAMVLLMKLSFPGNELYITRESKHTNIIARQNNNVTVYSTLPAEKIIFEHNRLNEKYRDWIATRGINSLSIVPLEEEYFDMRFGEDILRIVNCDKIIKTDEKAALVIVTSKYRGDIVQLAQVVNSDSILLSTEINKRRRTRYLRELANANIPARDLSESTFYKSF